jgi:type VI secretion system secreted protein Hcp
MATDFFLKVERMAGGMIAGESVDPTHKGEIELQSFTWALHQPIIIGNGSTGSGAGRASSAGITFVSRVSSATPLLVNACCAGVPLNVTLTARKAGGTQQNYYKIVFTNAAFSDYRSSATYGTDEIPRDEFTLVYGTCYFEYSPQDPKTGGLASAIKSGWDFIKNISM